jgi:phosphonate degradation associated HDIG domain protein
MSKALLADLTAETIVDKIEALFEVIMASSYLGEPVTVGEHMLQAAACARRDGAGDALIAAALLHDVGYYVDPEPDNKNELVASKRHDRAGARALAPFFPEAVTEPIRLHADAKRYLCAVEPDYRDKLSDASIHTMALQGGIMDTEEADAFARGAFCEAAVAMRRWDDEGKVAGADVPFFGDFRPMLERLVKQARTARN